MNGMVTTLEKCINFEEILGKFKFPLIGSEQTEFQEWKKLSIKVIEEHKKDTKKFLECLDMNPPALKEAFLILNSCKN